MATTGMLPTSNVGGNNQTSPGVSANLAAPQPVFQPMQGAGTLPSSNPMMPAAPTSAPAAGAGLYNTANSYGTPGQTDINKQLVDILGKGIGGSENKLLSSLSGVDSQVFQQWLAAQVPAQAQAEASARQGLAAQGVSGNSSVSGLMEANLASNFNAQAAAENANLMTQNINTTTGILQGAQNLAAQQVAQSPWSIAGQVIGEVGNVAGDFLGAGGIGGLFKPSMNSGSGFMPNATVDQTYMDPALTLPTSIS